MTQRTTPPPSAAAEYPADIASMRATAGYALALTEPPAADALVLLLSQLRGHLALMVHEVELLAARATADKDLAACLALAGVREAQRKLGLPTQRTALGQVTLAWRLARVLLALCSHHETLSGTR